MDGENVNRILTVLTALAAVALISADSANKTEPIPPDDPADVKILQDLYPSYVKLDANGNVSGITVSGWDVVTTASLGPALDRLRHVRYLGASFHADLVLQATRRWTTLEEVYLSHSDVSDHGLTDLEGMRKMKRLTVESCYLTDAGVKSIGKLKDLEALAIRGAPRITDACMKDIAGLSKLNRLDLRGCAISDRGLVAIKGLQLQFLGLDSTKITDRSVDVFNDIATLTELEVRNTKLTNSALVKIKRIHGMQVYGLPRIEVHEVPDDLKDVAAIHDLAPEISAPKDNVTDNVHHVGATLDPMKPGIWMKHLKGLHSLYELVLPQSVTEDGDLAYLVGLRSLQMLEANYCKFTNAGMKSIGTLASLRELRLEGCAAISPEGMKYLSRLDNLEVLRLSRTPVGDDALKPLERLNKLSYLDLSGANITDAGLAYLGKIGSLKVIRLDGTQITTAGLHHLDGLVSLRWVSCDGTSITRDAAMRIKKDFPWLGIPPTIPASRQKRPFWP
jgi:internalin A